MPNIIVTNECALAIRAAAILPFRQTGKQLPNGDWSIPIDKDVFAALQSKRLKGETLSDTIMRAIAAERGFN